jgi:phosphopantothenoylcysteine decarboxylase/phosphopantothenate--cysteine ligase
MEPLAGRTVALCVTGSIAAYKAVEVARLCVKAGARVIPVMTPSATRFVGAVTLSGICGEAAVLDMWDPSFSGEVHVSIGERAEVVVIVPATADVLSRLANGRADDVVTALALCARGPVVAAPAMHPRMWDHPATRKNLDELERQRRVELVGPVEGLVASGESGMGRMAEPAEIYAAIVRAITPQDLAGKRILVTAGPTFEDIDPVRYLANRSSGKMGFAIAERAALRGANVLLVAGPVSLATPAGVERVDVRSAADMRRAMRTAMGDGLREIDALVMSAAVADFRPQKPSKTKMKKGEAAPEIALAQNPDLLAEVGQLRGDRGRPLLVGFALETGDDEALVAYARRKLAEKNVDLVVANAAGEALGTEDNRAIFVNAERAEALPRMSKHALADALLDRIRDATEVRQSRPTARKAVSKELPRGAQAARAPGRKRGKPSRPPARGRRASPKGR